ETRSVRRSRRRCLPQLEVLEDRLTPALLTVNSLADAAVNLADAAVTLRDAIHAATNDLSVYPGGPAGSGLDEIRFQPGLGGTIFLNQGPLGISSDLTITGPGAGVLTVSGSGVSRVFEVSDSTPVTRTVRISGLTITGGMEARASGGGILNAEALTVQNSTIIGNSVRDFGGGLFNLDTASLTVQNSTI